MLRHIADSVTVLGRKSHLPGEAKIAVFEWIKGGYNRAGGNARLPTNFRLAIIARMNGRSKDRFCRLRCPIDFLV